jgi:multicomponent Na+:H+ antiporter subunit B
MTETFINFILFAMLVLTAIAIVRTTRLFAIVMLSGVISLLAAMLFVTLDAVDVAFTEAAVGAGISTVLMLGTIALTSRGTKPPSRSNKLPLLLVTLTGIVLVYGTLDMPAFGDPNAPAQVHVAPHYLNESIKEIDVPNVVTSVLASYRGFDTLGETAVVFAAGIGVLLILSGLRRRRRDDEEEDEA